MINGKTRRLAFFIELNFVISCLQQSEYRLRFFTMSMFNLILLKNDCCTGPSGSSWYQIDFQTHFLLF